MRDDPAAGPGLMIRPARRGEAAALSDLCLRSKAHWGYDAAFLERCRGPLTVSEAAIGRGRVHVAADAAGRALGVLALDLDGAEGAIDMLFVEPAAIGRGVGRALFRHAVAAGRAAGCRRLRVLSDPFAASFYRAMGAVDAGMAPSDAVPGRLLPVLVVDLAGGPPAAGPEVA